MEDFNTEQVPFQRDIGERAGNLSVPATAGDYQASHAACQNDKIQEGEVRLAMRKPAVSIIGEAGWGDIRLEIILDPLVRKQGYWSRSMLPEIIVVHIGPLQTRARR